MDNNLLEFKNSEFEVKIKLDENNNPTYNAEMVAKSLGIGEFKNDKYYVKWTRVNKYLAKYVSTQVSKKSFLAEPLVYKLAFKAGNEVAERFQDWLACEVIPTLNKTGGYVQENRESEFIDNYFPSFTDSTKLAMVQDLRKQNQEYKEEIAKLTPQAQAYQDLMTAQGYIKFIDLAQSIEIGRSTLLEFLRTKKVLTYQSNFNVPYGRFAKNGYFKVLHNKDDKGHYSMITMVSPKGMNYIYKLIKKNNLENEFNIDRLLSSSERTVA